MSRMGWILGLSGLMAAGGLGGALAGVPTPRELDGVVTVDTPQVKEAVAGRQAVLIDFRDSSAFGQTLPRALNCPVIALTPTALDETEVRKAAKAMEACASVTRSDKAKTIIVFCTGVECWSAPKAAVALTQMGYTKVHWYRRGVEGWIADGELTK